MVPGGQAWRDFMKLGLAGCIIVLLCGAMQVVFISMPGAQDASCGAPHGICEHTSLSVAHPCCAPSVVLRPAANYDLFFGAPACNTHTLGCYSGGLLDSRGTTMTPKEPNGALNTAFGSCNPEGEQGWDACSRAGAQ